MNGKQIPGRLNIRLRWIHAPLGLGVLYSSVEDPKDHLYGLMSLTNVNLEVEYSKGKSVGDVYRDYIVGLLKFFLRNDRS